MNKYFITGFMGVFQNLFTEIAKKKQEPSLHYFAQMEQDLNSAFEKLRQEL
ncbi:hypothetical protein [Candidatus Trichorickettsia mobilis]|uniref:hypothetical protein n=1 Tax=Candidatus Trichorickettsia mobilis TaxID=1346319 RepID=UPI0029307F74|nr:hypothetical protein [Candidatus Trichorickettsia mobilis]